MTRSLITIAVSKGRILDEALPLLHRAGLAPGAHVADSRRLVIDTEAPDVRLMVVRAADTGTYVRFGAADLGIMGKDQLMEEAGADLYELLDLRIARCRMVVAQPESAPPVAGFPRRARVRVGTKYPNVTRAHFARSGILAEPIRLYGSIELAPLVGLADQIVDLVDTGGTLKANGLMEVEHVADISSRLVANKASMKLKQLRMGELVDRLTAALP